MSEDTIIPFSSDNDFVDETEEDDLESLVDETETDLSDPEAVEPVVDEMEVYYEEEVVVAGPIVSDKPDEKLTKEYEAKLIRELFHRKVPDGTSKTI